MLNVNLALGLPVQIEYTGDPATSFNAVVGVSTTGRTFYPALFIGVAVEVDSNFFPLNFLGGASNADGPGSIDIQFTSGIGVPSYIFVVANLTGFHCEVQIPPASCSFIDPLTAASTFISIDLPNANQGELFVVTPVPAALPLFAGGLGVLGLLAWRRRKAAISA